MSNRRFHFVQSHEGLAEVARSLEGVDEIGLDAEMNGLHAFQARVCVLQIATEDLDVVIDTVAVDDLSPIHEAITRPGVTRYLHGAAHDVKCLKQDFQLPVVGLFDTYIAAQLLSVEKLGYGDIVQTRFGATLNKSLQTCDWGKRPLAETQIAYLRGDIRYLIELGRQLRAELVEKDLLEEAEYEFTRVAALPAEQAVLAEDAYLRPKASREMDPISQSVLRELFLARFELARKLDRPPFKVVGDVALLEIAKSRPASIERISAIPGLPRRGHGSVLPALLAAVERGVAAGSPPPIPRSNAPRVPTEEIRARRAREETLRAWRKASAAARGVPPMAVLPNYALEDLVRESARSLEDLSSRPGMIAKRIRLYGEELLALQAKPDAENDSRGSTGSPTSVTPAGETP